MPRSIDIVERARLSLLTLCEPGSVWQHFCYDLHALTNIPKRSLADCAFIYKKEPGLATAGCHVNNWRIRQSYHRAARLPRK